MTCSAQMHTELDASAFAESNADKRYRILDTRSPRDSLRRTQKEIRDSRFEIRESRIENRARGFTLTELIVVIVVVSMFVLLAQVHLFGLLRKSTFRAQAQELVSTMQMAAGAAAQSDRRYEVIIDIPEQRYLLRQITNPDLSQVLEEEVIVEDSFSPTCRVVYVRFDDGDFTSEDRAKFRAGHSGWAYGGKIVLLDEKEQPHSIVVSRLNRMITLEQGDVELLWPKTKDEVPF
jgi:prepilin-type N-terminal cleavage/methylation domain-containing protein